MRKLLRIFVALLLLFALAIPAAAVQEHIVDDAGLLTPQQRETLSIRAAQIVESHGIGIYIVTVEDFRNYGEEPAIFDVLWNYYHDNGLGYGNDRQGMILMLSMAERDYATFFYGTDTEYAFNSFGQKQLESYFLDDFREDNWYDGFEDYLTYSAEFMERAASGSPVRDNPWSLAAVFVLIAVFVSFVITRLLWMRMAGPAAQKSAAHYQTSDGLSLSQREDLFLNRSVIRRKIEQSSSDNDRTSDSNSVSHTGGGGSGRSGKF